LNSNLKNWIWWGLLLAGIGAVITFSFAMRNGGFLHGEADMYLVDHLGDRPFLSKVICPHSNDADQYQATELNHLFEYVDAHLIYWSYLAGHPHFISILSFVFFLIITCITWHWATQRLKIDRVTVFLLLGLFWTNPNFFFLGCYYRMAKQASSLFIFFCLYLLLKNLLCVGDDGKLKLAFNRLSTGNSAWLFFLGLAACFSDSQGFALVVLIGGLAALWAVLRRCREWAVGGVALLAAGATHAAYLHFLGSYVVLKFSGFEVTSQFRNEAWQRFHGDMTLCFKQAVSVLTAYTAFIFGDVPDWIVWTIAGGVLAGCFWLRPNLDKPMATKRNNINGWQIFVTLASAIVGLWAIFSVMMGAHPAIAWDDVQRQGYYALPYDIMLLVTCVLLTCLFYDRFPTFRRELLWVALGVLILFNLESLPEHLRIAQNGHLHGFIEATPEYLNKLKVLSHTPPASAPLLKKYDTIKASQLYTANDMIRNPMLDINFKGAVDGEAFAKTSRYMNFLRSKKGLSFYEPWDVTPR
jgi:hypothetical protein